MLSWKSPTAFIVCAIVALLGLVIGIVIPILLSSKLDVTMQESATLSRLVRLFSNSNYRGNFDEWSTIPGPYEFSMKKRVTLFELVDPATNSDEIHLKTGPVLNYTIERNISWTEFVDDVFIY